MRIFTHISVDLDAVCSIWAARKFIPGLKNATLEFRPANWDGSELGDDDIALDIEAGGRGLKGFKEENGTVHSCFATVMKRFAPPEDHAAIHSVIAFVDAQDAFGSAVEQLIPDASPHVKGIFYRTSLAAVHRAIKVVYQDDQKVTELLGDILDGMLSSGQARVRAVAEAEHIRLLGDGKVAISWNNRESRTNGVLFSDKGVRVIVYVDGFNLGIIRNMNLSLRMDHPDIRAVVERAGEIDEWFAHSSGFLFCRGSRKSPATSVSKVNPTDLAEVVVRLLSE